MRRYRLDQERLQRAPGFRKWCRLSHMVWAKCCQTEYMRSEVSNTREAVERRRETSLQEMERLELFLDRDESVFRWHALELVPASRYNIRSEVRCIRNTTVGSVLHEIWMLLRSVYRRHHLQHKGSYRPYMQRVVIDRRQQWIPAGALTVQFVNHLNGFHSRCLLDVSLKKCSICF